MKLPEVMEHLLGIHRHSSQRVGWQARVQLVCSATPLCCRTWAMFWISSGVRSVTRASRRASSSGSRPEPLPRLPRLHRLHARRRGSWFTLSSTADLAELVSGVAGGVSAAASGISTASTARCCKRPCQQPRLVAAASAPMDHALAAGHSQLTGGGCVLCVWKAGGVGGKERTGVDSSASKVGVAVEVWPWPTEGRLAKGLSNSISRTPLGALFFRGICCASCSGWWLCGSPHCPTVGQQQEQLLPSTVMYY